MDYVYLSCWVLGILPALIVVQHAVYLYLYRMRLTSPQFAPRPGLEFLRPAWEDARIQEQRDFSPLMLSFRYGLPALLIGVVGIAWFYLL